MAVATVMVEIIIRVAKFFFSNVRERERDSATTYNLRQNILAFIAVQIYLNRIKLSLLNTTKYYILK